MSPRRPVSGAGATVRRATCEREPERERLRCSGRSRAGGLSAPCAGGPARVARPAPLQLPARLHHAATRCPISIT